MRDKSLTCCELPPKEVLEFFNDLIYEMIKGKPMHKKIMEKTATALKRDAMHYAKAAKKAKSPVKKKHEKIEEKEARSAAKDMSKRVRKAHEY
jgi:flagellar biosynthesis protein FliP